MVQRVQFSALTQISSVADPSAPQDAATKAYVDSRPADSGDTVNSIAITDASTLSTLKLQDSITVTNPAGVQRTVTSPVIDVTPRVQLLADIEIAEKIGVADYVVEASVSGCTWVVSGDFYTITSSDSTFVSSLPDILRRVGFIQSGQNWVVENDRIFGSTTVDQAAGLVNITAATFNATNTSVTLTGAYVSGSIAAGTLPFVLTELVFTYVESPAVAIRKEAVGTMNAGTGISLTPSADGTSITITNTGPDTSTTVAAGTGIIVTDAGTGDNHAYTVTNAGITSLNTLTGDAAITAGANVSISTNSTTKAITISATGGGGSASSAAGINNGPVSTSGTTVVWNTGTDQSNEGTVNIGTNGGFSTNSAYINNISGQPGWQTFGQLIGSSVSDVVTGTQVFTIGVPQIAVLPPYGSVTSYVEGPYFRRVNGWYDSNPLTNLTVTVTALGTASFTYDVNSITTTGTGGNFPIKGTAINFASLGTLSNYWTQSNGYTVVSGTTVTVTATIPATVPVGTYTGRTVTVAQDQWPGYIGQSGNPTRAILKPRSPLQYRFEILVSGNTNKSFTLGTPFQFGSSWYVFVTFTGGLTKQMSGGDIVEFSLPLSVNNGAAVYNSLISDTGLVGGGYNLRIPGVFASAPSLSFTGTPTANAWVAGTPNSTGPNYFPLSTDFAAGPGTIRVTYQPNTFTADSANGAFPNGFITPQTVANGGTAVAWDLFLPSGSATITNATYSNTGVNGYLNNTHSLNGIGGSSLAPSLQSVLKTGNTTGGNGIIHTAGDVDSYSSISQFSIADGIAGQVVRKAASGNILEWYTPSSGFSSQDIINLSAAVATATQDGTFQVHQNAFGTNSITWFNAQTTRGAIPKTTTFPVGTWLGVNDPTSGVNIWYQVTGAPTVVANTSITYPISGTFPSSAFIGSYVYVNTVKKAYLADFTVNTINGAVTLNSWEYYALSYKVTATTAITGGSVYTLTKGATNVYRFVSTATTGNYPTTDAIYTTFDGTNQPTGLIVQRGV